MKLVIVPKERNILRKEPDVEEASEEKKEPAKLNFGKEDAERWVNAVKGALEEALKPYAAKAA